MTVRSVPIFLQAGSHPAEETRLMLGGMLGTVTGSFAGGVASSDPAHGVVRATDFAVTQNGTPNMSVNVAAGGAFIRGTQNANQGAYHVWNDGTVNLSISAADATNGRRDLVIAQVRDSYYSGATNDARITVVTGTPAASPVDPSLASFPNALVLARITVAAGDTAINTADITDLRTVANQSGKLPVFTTQALATTAIPSPYDGQGYYLNSGTATEGPLYWHGSAYRLPWSMPWGVQLYAVDTVNTRDFTTTPATITNITGSVSVVNNRTYRCTFQCRYLNTSVGVVNSITMRAGGTGFWTALQNNYSNINDQVYTSVGIYRATSTATLTFDVQAGAGSGTMKIYGANGPTQFTVEDIGPYGAPS
jgi:hypothetical protein